MEYPYLLVLAIVGGAAAGATYFIVNLSIEKLREHLRKE